MPGVYESHLQYCREPEADLVARNRRKEDIVELRLAVNIFVSRLYYFNTAFLKSFNNQGLQTTKLMLL